MATKTIFVTGHKNPDTDTIISSMAYAYLKQRLGFDAIAVRLGELNPETQYVLNLFNEFAPPLARDIKMRIRDVDFDDVLTCRGNDSFKKTLTAMTARGKKVAAVTDEGRHLLGVVTVSDIMKPLVVDLKRKAELLSVTPLESIVNVLDAEVIYDSKQPHNGEIYIPSYDKFECQNRIIILPEHSDRIMRSLENGARMLVISGKCPAGVKEKAMETGCTVLTTSLEVYEITREIDQAIPVKLVMTDEITTFKYDDYLDDVKVKINKSRFRSYPIIDTNEHVVGMISRFHVLQHPARNLILVDHNELSQSIDGAEDANIMEIIDHHRIGGIKTAKPVVFRNEQTGSCATIITSIFWEKNIEIPPDLAGMLCCAILSDTVNFQSVTCTDRDRRTAEKLAEKAGLKLEKIGPEILKAGANMANKTAESILHYDLKHFEIGKLRVAVGQNNIVSYESIVPVRESVLNYMEQYAKYNGLNICAMIFSLIDGSGSYALFAGSDRSIARYAFDDIGVSEGGFLFLPKVMSRKIQIIPRITAAIEGGSQ